ncbi:MAG TPA: NADH-quinone oxidoreductase subunit C [Patescibacteria group bacterium]|nr:NADH-quinone oxidoreductase subunit C [Patescibacteria group bacterium]
MFDIQEVPAAALRAAANVAYHNGKNPLVAMFANDERGIRGDYAIYCLFHCKSSLKYQVVRASLPPVAEPDFPSLTPVISAAAWYEREIHDLFGLVPVGHPDLRPLVLHENWPRGVYPLRKDFLPAVLETAQEGSEYPIPAVAGHGVFEVPVGPIHAGIIEPGHFRFSQAGENVINLEAKLFFTHRGIEKSVEGLSFDEALYRVERICGACTVSHALSYSQAVENLTQAEVPLRARYLRVLTAEMERLYNHVGDIGNLCAGMGFSVGISNGARLKEVLMRLNERLTGNRFLRGMIVPGGVRQDITPDLTAEAEKVLNALDRDFMELAALLKDNDAFLDRVNTTGVLTPDVALDLAVVGVAARASGIDRDVRRDTPYAVYSELDFSVPTEKNGDVAARLWVRVEEVKQSVKLIRQVLGRLPDGPLRVSLPPAKPHTFAFSLTESPRGANCHWVMSDEHNRIFRLFVRSASYPNWMAVPTTVPGNIIPDFPLINKSFELCYACLDR